MIKKRTTVYLEDKLVKILKVHSIRTGQSTSEYINRIISQDLLEEQQDLKDIQKILAEPTVPLEKVLKELKIK
ncbi:MAG: ribbon-helix-helix protein, CopG family [Candidatus Omnitrophica bacterium]|nr:ribbon-helix-helix protein, CopG family [Candidatus Omnitrophota bacterium]